MNTIQKCKNGLIIFNRKDTFQSVCLDNYGEFLENQSDLFKELISENDVIYDIGANIGCLTILFARLAIKGLVFSFEPERHSFNNLCGNLAINNLNNVYAYQYALSNTTGSIFVPELNHELEFNQGFLNLKEKYNCSGYQSILTTVDSVKSNKCNFIKINACSMEKEVLEGSIETINKNKPIIFISQLYSDCVNEILDFANKINYETFLFKHNVFRENNFYNKKENVFKKQFNDELKISSLLFLPKEHLKKEFLINKFNLSNL